MVVPTRRATTAPVGPMSKPKLKVPAVGLMKRRVKRGTNLSRKSILAMQRERFLEKKDKKKVAATDAKEKIKKSLTHMRNKKSNKAFDSTELKCVHEGIVATITSLGETPGPLSLLASSMTAIHRAVNKSTIPYLLTILAASLPHLRQPLLLHQCKPILTLLQQVMSENHSDNLILNKSMACAQSLMLSIDQPTEETFQMFKVVEPSKLHSTLMPLYLTLIRKGVQSTALRRFHSVFFAVLPSFVSLCTSMFSGAQNAIVTAATTELTMLFQKTISPEIVESGHGIINRMIVTCITELFKPHYREHWIKACGLVETLFNHLSFVKRKAHVSNSTDPAFPQQHYQQLAGAQRFIQWFPCSKFLLQVLNKIRHVDDTTLNTSVEKAMVAIGLGMSVRDVVNVLPFDPRRWCDVQASNLDNFWKDSYTVNIIRKVASHDDLCFFKDSLMPIAKYCHEMVKECELSPSRLGEVSQWSALWLQYWRVCVGFCNYPIIITEESFREVAKALVALLSTALVDTAATALSTLSMTYHRLASKEQEDDDDEEEIEPEHIHDKTNLDEDEAYLRMFDETWNLHCYHSISQAEAQRVCKDVLAKFSSNIMPRLCNTYETHESTALLDAISNYAKVCSPSVMNVIVQGILDMGLTIAAEETHAINPKRRMILSIACAVIPQLSTTHLEALLGTVVEPILSDPSPQSRLLQKRAYKLLFSFFEYRVKDLLPHLIRILNLLHVGQQHVTVSGLKMRIKCVSWAIDAVKIFQPDNMFAVVQGCLGEVVLCAREHNSACREIAMDLLEKMQRYITGNGEHSHMTLIHKVLGGLSGKTGMLVSSTIVCLAKLIWVSYENIPQNDMSSIIAICVRMLESAVTEIRTAAANFSRMILNLSKRSPTVAEALKQCLPQLTQAIALATSQVHVSSSTRVLMRVILEKSIKRFTFETVEKVFPMGSKRFLLYTHRILRREERQNVKDLEKMNTANRDEFKELFIGSALKQSGDGAGEDGDDLLQDAALSNFVAHKSALTLGSKNHADDDDDADDKNDNMCLVFESDGKIRIVERGEKKREDEEKRRRALADRLLRKGSGLITAATFSEGDQRKRGRDEENAGAKRGRGRDDDDDEDDENVANDELILRYGSTLDGTAAKTRASAFAKDFAGRTGTAPTTAAAISAKQTAKLHAQIQDQREAKRIRLEQDIRKGEEYGTEKGAGDVKRGAVDPFAYVPLNRRYMNKRHRRESVLRFEAVSHTGVKGNKAISAEKIKKKKRK